MTPEAQQQLARDIVSEATALTDAAMSKAMSQLDTDFNRALSGDYWAEEPEPEAPVPSAPAHDTASVVERLLAETPAEAIRSDTRSLRRLPDGTVITGAIADAYLQRLAVMHEDYEQPQIDLDLQQRLMKADRSLDYIEYGNDHWSEAEDPSYGQSVEEQIVRGLAGLQLGLGKEQEL